MINKVAISDIKIPTRKRGLSEDKVKELAESIKELGLLQPIIISEDKVLISGLHRIEACKLLGWSEIPCIVKSYNQLDKELAEIDENLVRAELSVLERAEALKRRKEIYEVKYPETKPEIKRKSGLKQFRAEIVSPRSTFSEDTAQKLGVSSRTIRHEVQIAEKIDNQVKEKIKDTELADNKKELLLLARLEPEKQRQVVDKIAKGEAKEVSKALLLVKMEKYKKIGEQAPIPTNITLLEGDCLEKLKEIPDHSIDCVITDPPYGTTDREWDIKDIDFQKKWLKAVKPKLKNSFHMFIFFDSRRMYDMYQIISEFFKVKNTLIWVRKNISMGRVVKDNFISAYEVIFFISQNKDLNFPADWGSERFNVFEYAVPQSNFKDTKLHPTQKPLELIKILVEVGSYPGETILDLFAGSGVVGLACKELKRNCILIEQDKEYIKIAKGRLNE